MPLHGGVSGVVVQHYSYTLTAYEGLETDDCDLPVCVLRPYPPHPETSSTSVQGGALSFDKQGKPKWIKCMLACIYISSYKCSYINLHEIVFVTGSGKTRLLEQNLVEINLWLQCKISNDNTLSLCKISL